ncbi:MAG: hypothetical protein O2967_05605 [Proteobacteria bacterium]|nr:hypothetical protein [Pseudomonadota bacterium]
MLRLTRKKALRLAKLRREQTLHLKFFDGTDPDAHNAKTIADSQYHDPNQGNLLAHAGR